MNIPQRESIADYVLFHFNQCYSHGYSDNALLNQFVFTEPISSQKWQLFIKEKPQFYEFHKFQYPLWKIAENEIHNLSLHVFFFLSGMQEWLIEERDQRNRFTFKNSLQHKHHFIQVPVVNIYLDLIANLLTIKGFSFKKLKTKKVVLSHDIDTVTKGRLEKIGYLMKKKTLLSAVEAIREVFKMVNNKNDLYTQSFKTIFDIEKNFNAHSIWFFLSNKSNIDADYELDDPAIIEKLQEIAQLNNKISLHPGYDTYNNLSNYRNQLLKFEQKTKVKVNAVRHHFLRYDIKTTPLIQEKMNIHYDFSLGFADHFGFRNGFTNAFKLYHFGEERMTNVWHIPLYFMDGTISHYMNGNRQTLLNDVLTNLKNINQQFSIHYSILFHNTAFVEPKYEGFKSFYYDLLTWLNWENVDLSAEFEGY
jgi:hypothetical protein